MLGLLLAATLCAAPAAGTAKPAPSLEERFQSLTASVPAPVQPLAEADRGTAKIPVEQAGQISVENVRRRLGVLAMISSTARPRWQAPEVESRLLAHLIVAHAGIELARSLYTGKSPQAAKGAASRAWAEQLERTMREVLTPALGHLRSCAALSHNSKQLPEVGQLCQDWLRELAQPLSLPLKERELASLVKARSGELSSCIDQQAADPPAGQAVVATLALDGLGRVASVELTPKGSVDASRTGACLREVLGSWVLPDQADVELEVPLQLSPGK